MPNKKNFLRFSVLASVIALLILFNGCASVMKQVEGILTLTKCEFRLASLSEPKLAGISVERIASPSDLSFSDAARLTLALTQAELPLTFRLNVEVKNPNQRAASLTRFQWRLFIDDLEMTAGTVSSPVSISANATAIVPMEMTVDLKKSLAGRSLETLKNFAFNLAGVGGKPTRVMLRVKPSLQVGSMMIDYPNEIDVRTEFTGGKK
ncbi:MAG: LEA type 2 family protein [Chloroherpetonaceae bacterium]|nr:LEA type 2 family protein [Chloroherpetonaceae bacterium]